MKNKLKYVLSIVGVAIIIFGALIPVIFKENNSSVDRFTYDRDSGFSEYSVTVNVVSSKEYSINSITITLQDAFDKYNTKDKLVNSPVVTKKKDGNDFVYTIVISITQDEFFDYAKVSSVTLSTNIGQRIAEEKEMIPSFSWQTPVMIIIIFVGVGLTIAGIVMFVVAKAQKSAANNAKIELAKNHPEINTDGMTDAEILTKYNEIKSENQPTLAEVFGLETKPKERICEYCGSTNDADSKKCSNCGANLKSKK